MFLRPSDARMLSHVGARPVDAIAMRPVSTKTQDTPDRKDLVPQGCYIRLGDLRAVHLFNPSQRLGRRHITLDSRHRFVVRGILLVVTDQFTDHYPVKERRLHL